MCELKNDPFYALIADYPACVVDYCLLACSEPYRGAESHREALGAAMAILSMRDGDEEEPAWSGDVRLARAKKIDAQSVAALPDEPLKQTVKEKDGTNVTFYKKRTDGGALTHAQAFLLPPHGSSHAENDFRRVNAALFPNGTENLEAYDWSTDWSDYFDDGHEWWGVLCLTVYDESLDRFAVIMASATD